MTRDRSIGEVYGSDWGWLMNPVLTIFVPAIRSTSAPDSGIGAAGAVPEP